MPSRKPIPEYWQDYNVAELIRRHRDQVDAHNRERTRLEQSQHWDSSAELFRKNMLSVGMRAAADFLDTALRVTGPVRYEGRLYKSSSAAWETPVAADDSVPDAETIWVEIHSPHKGLARLKRPPAPGA